MLTIAVAIAGNATIFSVADPVLFRPLPFAHAERIVTLDARAPQGFYISTSIPNYRDWGARSRVFDRYGAAAPRDLRLSGRGDADVLDARAVIGDFFGVLGIAPLLGRVTTAPEHEPGATPVVVLGHAFWRQRLGGDTRVLGEVLMLDERPHTIVGVLPEGVGFPSGRTQAYVPMGSIPGLQWDERDMSFGTRSFARLNAGTSLAEARGDLQRVHRQIELDLGEPAAAPEVRPLSDLLLGSFRPQVWLLVGAVAFLLLIAVANAANLQLVRAEERRREVALRTALGARPRIIVLEMLSESALITAGGGVLGLAIAALAVHGILPLLAADMPAAVIDRVAIDGRVILFTFLLATVTGTLFGLVPALGTGRTDITESIKAGTHSVTSASHRLRSTLVVAEMALALVLLIGAGLMLTSLRHLRDADKGFEPDRVVTARIPLSTNRYPNVDAWRGFHEQLLDRVHAMPGVQSAAVTLLLPLTGRSWERGALPEGRSIHEQRESVLFGVVSTEYFRTLGVPLLRGRPFTTTDRDGSMPVAIIDERMAEAFWPGEDPIGKRLFFEVQGRGPHDRAGTPVLRTVVGVAQNVRHYELTSQSRIQLYVPLTQTRGEFGMVMSLAVKGQMPAASFVPALRHEVADMDPSVPLTEVRTLHDIVDDELSSRRAIGALLVLFSAVALALAGIGIFGVMSYVVARRTREIAIRMALGAERRRILGWVSRQSATLTLAGIVLGWLASVGLTRALAAFLYGVEPVDVTVYVALAGFLAAVAGLAVIVPALRATRVNPSDVLRQDI